MALTRARACRLVAGTLALGFCSSAAWAATAEDGRRAYDAGHFTDAMGIWAALSKEGNAGAAFGLGLLYDLGNGAPENPETAFFWYKLAAEAGLPEAEFNVGAMYDGGRGVSQSSGNAALWYAKAAAQGHHRAQFDLGLLYQQGDGVPRNPDAAGAWFRKAAAGGIKAAATRLKTLEAAAPNRAGGPVAAVTQVSPASDASLILPNADSAVELVWIAPAEPQPVHYEVQVRELGGPTPRTIFTASMAETAAVIRLPQNADFYTWTVDTIAQDGSHTAGDWSWFSVGSTHPSEQSMAAVPATSPLAVEDSAPPRMGVVSDAARHISDERGKSEP
ncbi:MAG: sel1 repeat family protein, partial [Pseudomonadota bacterium]|nr:sel1 repeat family protein [Pseudomonadota bacterium]